MYISRVSTLALRYPGIRNRVEFRPVYSARLRRLHPFPLGLVCSKLFSYTVVPLVLTGLPQLPASSNGSSGGSDGLVLFEPALDEHHPRVSVFFAHDTRHLCLVIARFALRGTNDARESVCL